MANKRIDVVLIEKGLVESRSLAQKLVMAGQVRSNGLVVMKPSSKVPTNAHIEVIQRPPYVSRGGEKLAGAIEPLSIEIKNKICVDVGASTGGFTDCMLQNDAKHVYCIDVGKGILHWKIRKHPKVTVMEQTNARYVTDLPEPIDLITIDASFISLKVLLPVVKKWISPEGGNIIALIKPQFEAGRKIVSKNKGVIRDEAIHKEIVVDILAFCEKEGFSILGIVRSSLKGPKGNIEFLVKLAYPKIPNQVLDENVIPTLFPEISPTSNTEPTL
jgi:23S rRNA (cytidine1920-2'-O)/16S rRNA (cytidine1409-2'-O)-methyltransferase